MSAPSSSSCINLTACADIESTEVAADFWNVLRSDDRHCWDAACSLYGLVSYNSELRNRLRVLSNARMLDEVYSYFRLFEPEVSIRDTSNRLSDLVSIDQMCERSTQISMDSDRVLFRDEPLSNKEYEHMLLSALLCAHPLLRYPLISRIPQASMRILQMSTARFSGNPQLRNRNTSVREHTASGNVSVSDNDESSNTQPHVPISTSCRSADVAIQERHSCCFSADQSPPNQSKIDRCPDVRHELLSTKTLCEYVCNAFKVTPAACDHAWLHSGETQSTSAKDIKMQHVHDLCTVAFCASPIAPGNVMCHEIVLEHYMPYASEKTEHGRLLIRIVKEQRKLLTAIHMHAQDCEAFTKSVDLHRIREGACPLSSIRAENAEDVKRRSATICSRRSSNNNHTHLTETTYVGRAQDFLTPITVHNLERCVDKNFKALESHGKRSGLDTHILDRAFEDSFVHTLTLSLNNNKRFYFHLLHTLVAFEIKRWSTEPQTPRFGAGCDLFDVSCTADGAVILEESCARLLVYEDFHQVAYFGALVKCYSLTNRAFYFSHTTEILLSIVRLPVAQLPPHASLEREIVNNAATTLVNEMLSDMRYYLNKFVDTFTDEAHCVAWLQLFCTALRLRKHVNECSSADCNDDPQLELVRATKQYCYDRLLRLKEWIARALSYRTTPVAVSFVRVLVLRREIARLIARGVSRAFQSVCRVSLAQLLAQTYFFECLRYAETVIKRFLEQKNYQSSRGCAEQLALVYLLRRLETGEWKALLTANCHATPTEMVENVYAYYCFTQLVSELWNTALALVLRDCSRLQMKALLRETLVIQVTHGPVRCSGPLLDCLVLLLRFSHFFFMSVTTLFIEPPPLLAQIPTCATTLSAHPLWLNLSSISSGYSSQPSLPESINQSILSSCADVGQFAATSLRLCRSRLDYLRCVSSLLLPFAFTSTFSELSDQPTARLMRVFNEQHDKLWKHFVAHCIDRHDLLSLLLQKQLIANAPNADCLDSSSYSHLIKALKYAQVHLLLLQDSPVETDKEFLLKFTRSLAARLNDLYLLHKLVQKDVCGELMRHYFTAVPDSNITELGASFKCSSCDTSISEAAKYSPILDNEFLTRDVDQLEGECAFCYSGRLVQLTVTSTVDQLIRSCCLIITAYLSKAYTDVFTCSYLQVSRILKARRLETLESVEQQVIDGFVSWTSVDEQLFPASFFLSEMTALCSSSFISSNARAIMIPVFSVAVVQLRDQYRAFLHIFANPIDTCVAVSSYSERMHATYLRFSAEHLLACARQHSLTIDKETMLVLGRLLCLLELHFLDAERLLFVWCILEDGMKLLHSQTATVCKVAVAERVSKVDFAKCLSTLFSLRFNGYNEMAQRFRAAGTTADTSLIRIAARVYGQFAQYDIRSLDALVVLLLRRCYQQQDQVVTLVHQQVQSHRLQQAARYLDSQLHSEPKDLLHQRLVALINDLNTPSQFQDELAPYVDRLVKNNTWSQVHCFCWSSALPYNRESTK